MPNGQVQEQGFDKDLLLYFLSGAGRSLSEEGSTADVIGGMTQQHIRAKSQMALIKQLLAGGGKLNMDKENISLKAPVSAFKGGGMDDTGISAMEDPGGLSPSPQPTPTGQPVSGYGVLNPSEPSTDISSASLAGLTPEDISQALQLKLGFEDLRRKKLSDLMTYAGAARKDTRTALQKNYEVAQSQGFTGTIVDFQNTAETAHKKNYDEAVAGGYEGTFHNWMLEMTKAGAINLGDLREREVLKDEIDFEKQITSPDFVQEAEEFVTENQRLEYEAADDPERKKLELVIKQIESKLASDIVKNWDASIEGDYIVWNVVFKDGRTAKIRKRK